ncbi:MAG TPA: DUF2235 domain-containing protein [Longimicrobiales bacterium]
MKRLIVCCDGTWNRADQQSNGTPCPTNVVKLAYRVAKRDDHDVPQIVYYDQGVGTGNVLDRFSGGAFGSGLDDNIFDAYRFLIANYEPGDEVFLFGFSRGAFTARSIGGMIRKCGVLQRTHVNLYIDALRLYRSADIHPDDGDAVQFRSQNSCCGADPVFIKCIGVWDTVGALGIPLRGLRALTQGEHRFHDTELSGIVQYAFHALAIDERRAPFMPTLWDEKPKPSQTVSQTWFPGVHSDVGGGYAQNALSDITLQWMIDNAAMAGLAFDRDVLAGRPLHGNPTGVLHNSKTGFYRLTPGESRTISVTRSQTVHPSAIARWDQDPSYRPGTLRNFFKEVGDARADAH